MHLIAPESRFELSEALRLMTAALDVLDELQVPGEIGSILDLAIARLDKFLHHGDHSATSVQALTSQLERELAASPASDGSRPSPWEITSA